MHLRRTHIAVCRTGRSAPAEAINAAVRIKSGPNTPPSFTKGHDRIRQADTETSGTSWARPSTGLTARTARSRAVLAEAHDEWQVGDRRYLSEGSMAALAAPPVQPKEVATPHFSRHDQQQPADQTTVKITCTTSRPATPGRDSRSEDLECHWLAAASSHQSSRVPQVRFTASRRAAPKPPSVSSTVRS